MLVNWLLKSIGVGEASLYLDEAYSVYLSQQSLGAIFEAMELEANPPGHFVLLFCWIKAFGIGPAAVRSLSVLFSGLTAFLLVRIGHRNGSLAAGIIASLLFTLSPMQFDFAQEARGFAMVSFLATLSIGFYLAVLRDQRRGALIGLALTNLMLLYTHYATFLIPLMQTLLLLASWKVFVKVWRQYVLFNGIALLAFLPLLLRMSAAKLEHTSKWLLPPQGDDIWPVMEKVYGGNLVLILGVFLVVLTLILVRLKKQSLDRRTWVFLAGSIGTVLLGWLVSQKVSLFTEKYLLFTSIPFFLLMGWLIAQLKFPKALLLLFAVGSLGLTGLNNDFKKVSSEDWKAAVPFAQTLRTHPNTYTLVTPNFNFRPFIYYYDQARFRNGDRSALTQELYYVDQVIFVDEIRIKNFFEHQMPTEIVTVQLSPNGTSRTAINNANILTHYREVTHQKFKGLEVRKFELKTP